MDIKPVAVFHSPLTEKFGIPRQAGLAPSLTGRIVLEPAFRAPEALRGLDGFDYLWLIWGFSLNHPSANPSDSARLTVRPPRLGGNERVGVFASRSPFRPNGMGLSSVKIESVDFEKGEIVVSGADLADGTPVYDIKPYVEYADSHVGVRSGFVDREGWQPLEVIIPPEIAEKFDSKELTALREVLSQDPRPQYQDDPSREYGMAFAGRNIRFRVKDRTLTATHAE